MTELPSQRDFDDFAAWPGRAVLGPGGDRLGTVEVIFLDEATGVPEWVLVALDDGAAFVPLADASVGEDSIRVAHEADRVADAPRVDADDTLSVADEKRLYEHYGLEYSREESSTVLPEGATVQEEPRPRLRKYVGAPVTAPAAPEATPEAPPAAEATPEAPAAAEATPEPRAAADMAPRNLSSATPSRLPPAPPTAIPPQGGFQAQQALEQPTSKLRVVSAVLAGAIAGLIAVLAFRRARR